MKKNRLLILFVLLFVIGIGNVSASAGIVCYYSSDDTFSLINEDGNSYSSGASQQRSISHFPSACVIGVIERSSGKYSSALHCKTKNDSDKYYEVQISDYYDKVFGVNAPNWKTVYGYENGKGVTKCPSVISFQTNSFKTLPNPTWQAGEFAFNDKYGCECKHETTMDATCNHCMKLVNSINVSKKSEWKKMDTYKEKLEDMLSGKQVTFDTDIINPTVGTQPPNSLNSSNNSDENKKLIDKIKNATGIKDESLVIKNGELTCTELLGTDNVKLISTLLLYICVVGVVLVIVLGSTDFVRAVASSDEDALAQAFKRIKNRLISVVVLLLLPVLVNMILSFANGNVHFEVTGENEGEKDVSIKIGNVTDCGLAENE